MTDSISIELNSCRKNLADALGNDMKIYLQLLKSWFKKKMSREDFDHEARGLLSTNKVHLHNQFLLAILTKCQNLGASLASGGQSPVVHSTQPAHYQQMKKLKSKGKPVIGPTALYCRERRLTSKSSILKKSFTTLVESSKVLTENLLTDASLDTQRFMPVDALCQAPQIQSHFPEQDDRVPEFATHDLLLPDIAMVHGRLVVTAWEFGLDGVQDDAVRMLAQSVETMLKTVLSVVVMKRKSYQLREGCFRHSFGTHLPLLKLRNASLAEQDTRHPTSMSSQGSLMPAMIPSVEMAQHHAAVQVASSPANCYGSSSLSPISLFDLLLALQVHKSALPSHTVYTLNIERILNRLSHPSREELTEESISQGQETSMKHLDNSHLLLPSKLETCDS